MGLVSENYIKTLVNNLQDTNCSPSITSESTVRRHRARPVRIFLILSVVKGGRDGILERANGQLDQTLGVRDVARCQRLNGRCIVESEGSNGVLLTRFVPRIICATRRVSVDLCKIRDTSRTL